MLAYLRYRYAKIKMAAYVNGDLQERTRRVVSRLIDQDPRCYEEYRRQVAIKTELQRELPVIGRPDQTSMAAIWDNIMHELAAELPPQPRQPRSRGFGYGVLVVVFAAMVLMPLVTDSAQVQVRTDAVPPPAIAVTEDAPLAAQRTADRTQVAQANLTTTVRMRETMTADLQNTPASRTPSR